VVDPPPVFLTAPVQGMSPHSAVTCRSSLAGAGAEQPWEDNVAFTDRSLPRIVQPAGRSSTDGQLSLLSKTTKKTRSDWSLDKLTVMEATNPSSTIQASHYPAPVTLSGMCGNEAESGVFWETFWIMPEERSYSTLGDVATLPSFPLNPN